MQSMGYYLLTAPTQRSPHPIRSREQPPPRNLLPSLSLYPSLNSFHFQSSLLRTSYQLLEPSRLVALFSQVEHGQRPLIEITHTIFPPSTSSLQHTLPSKGDDFSTWVLVFCCSKYRLSLACILHHMGTSCFSCFPWTRAENNLDLELKEGTNIKLYSYRELSHATDNFSNANKLGQGGFGAVYKAKLKDGSSAAIKVLSAESQQGVKEFLTEINVISSMHHENLVELYGCCVDGKRHMLVYEYLENNSLAKTLLEDGSEVSFNWKTRREICIGIARGLAYLHEAKPHIVHRDIKASNILLDRELNAKISDFGLARFLPTNKTHVSTRVAGTVGYVAPEYAYSGHVARNTDVYSFGVLLLEIVCGRSNTNLKLPHDERYLLERVWVLHGRNELVGIVDGCLDGQFDAEEACRFLKISLLCTQDKPKSRPPMSRVVKMLEGMVDVNAMNVSRPALITDFLTPREDFSKGTNSTTNVDSDRSSSVATPTSQTFSAILGRD